MRNISIQDFHDRCIDGLEFCRLTYSLYEQIRSESGGAERLRDRKNRDGGALIEELLPLCKYVQSYHGPGRYLSVRWLNGNQPFDAEIYSAGAYVDDGSWPATFRVEITSAMHENDHLTRERLKTHGHAFGPEGLRRVKGKGKGREILSEVVVYDNASYVQDLANRITRSIEAKVAKDYADNTTLIVNCFLSTVFFRDEWEVAIAMARQSAPAHRFNSIFITESNAWLSGSL